MRRPAMAVSALAAAGAALLGVEVLVARRGPIPEPGPPLPYDAAAGPPGPPEDTVVWLGDSTAAGLGATEPAGTLPAQVAALLGRPVRLSVLARSGDRVADVLRDQLPRLAELRPTLVLISVGTNDTTHLTPRPRFRREYAAMLAGLPSSVDTVVVLGIPDGGAPPRLAQPLRAVAGWRGRRLDADVRRIAARHAKARYVDIAGRTGLMFRAQPTAYFAPDRYHPSSAGYGLWAQAVADTLNGAPNGPRGGRGIGRSRLRI